MLYFEMLFVIVLVLINGTLAMSEMAVVSSRKARLNQMAGLGNRGARVALRLIEDPSRFLSTVQIGITLVGILAGAFSGATLADQLGDWFDTIPLIAPNGDTIGIAIVVAAITYLSLVVGELVPKRIALTNPERVASTVAGPMHVLSRVAAPAVWLLRVSTESALRVLGLSGVRETTVTQEEVKSLIAEGAQSGVFEPQERDMIEGVLRMGDRRVRVIMTPRTAIVWIDVNSDRAAILKVVDDNRFSCLLVCDGSVDKAVGIVHAKNLLPAALSGGAVELRTLMTPALIIPESTPVLKILEQFKRDRVHMAVVVDEYGTTEGLVTLTDVLESIAGDLPERGEETGPLIVQREDGSWLVDGMLPLDEFEDRTGMRGLQGEGTFHTVAGFILQHLGHLPKTGESFMYRDARFEVVDLDERRIDKVLVQFHRDVLGAGNRTG
jgi:putative hemolysin